MFEKPEFCPKCGRSIKRTEGLQRHHILARQDGGTDEPENICFLCLACHKEWESFECWSKLPFEDWLELPSGNDLAIFCWGIRMAIKRLARKEDGDKELEDLANGILRVMISKDYFHLIIGRSEKKVDF